MTELTSFGEWLKRQRMGRGLTREQLAHQIGCAAVTLRKIEAEERRPSAQIVERLAEILNIPQDQSTSFLRFARGDWQAAPTGVAESFPWLAAPPKESQPAIHLATFLFTDIEGSAKLWDEVPEKMKVALQRHHTILQEAITSNGGSVFQVVGDAFCAAFPTVQSAISAAVRAQRELYQEPWDLPFPIRVRMGIHTGEAEQTADNPLLGGYASNQTLNRVARMLSAAHGGQILLSLATTDLVKDSLPTNTELRDMGEHHLRNLIHAEHLFQLNIAGLPSEFPPLNTLTRRHNLPVQLTSFIGREKEVEQIKKRLEKNRLVTLTGSGGIGKTRLSIQVASELLDEYPNGVWLVELASITDPSLVVLTVCSVLDVTSRGNTPAFSVLMEYLKPKKTLLVMDNCEHLIEACAQLCDSLLHTCPKMEILATSREALGINGENVYRVPSLSLPTADAGLRAIEESEAVRLFLERANTVHPDFDLTESNAPVVARICQRLDGIALAIELAAARIKGLSVEQISERLDDRFRLLTSGSRTALPRHQTLRAMIEWSYDLLSESEQALLRRLSVFVSDWTLEAAEAVCAQPNPLADSSGSVDQAQAVLSIETHEVMDLLLRLVDKSLVIPEEHTGQVRYRMLETIRQFARDKLSDSAEDTPLRARHLEFFLKFAEQAEPKLKGAEQLIWLNQLGAEYENLRAALDWARESGSTQPTLRLAKATEQLGDVQSLRGLGTRAIPLYQEALELWRSVKGADRMLEARLHGKIIQTVAILKGRIDREQFEALLPVAATSRAGLVAALEATKSELASLEKIHLLTTLSTDATHVRVPADWDLAEGYARDAVEMAEELNAPLELYTALGNLAELYFSRRLWRERLQVELRRLALSRKPRFGDMRGQAVALIETGWTLMWVGEFAQAMAHLLEAQSLAAQLQNVDLEKWALEGRTYCLRGLDRWDEILNLDEKLRDMQHRYPSEQIGPSCVWIALMASIHAMRGEMDLARSQRQEAQDIMTAGSGPFENWARNQHY